MIGGGEQFNVGKWMGEYAKMSPEAKQAFFIGKPELRQAHDVLAKALGNYKDVGKFGNPSRSGYVNTIMSFITGGTGGVAAVQGIPEAAVAAGTAYGANRGFAGLMSSPKFVRWLAKEVAAPSAKAQGMGRNLTRGMVGGMNAANNKSGAPDGASPVIVIRPNRGAYAQ